MAAGRTDLVWFLAGSGPSVFEQLLNKSCRQHSGDLVRFQPGHGFLRDRNQSFLVSTATNRFIPEEP
jgi:hypothetical protein